MRARTVDQSVADPYSIVRATLLFEHLRKLADEEGNGGAVHVRPVLVQPVAARDVVRLLAAVAVDTPLKGCIEIGGPEPFYLDGLVQRVLGAGNDRRAVIGDSHARYFGALPGERSLVAGDEAELGEIRFDDWLRHQGVNGAGRCAGTCAGASAAVASAAVGRTAGASAAVSAGRSSVAEPAALKANEFRVGDVPPGSVLLMGDVAVFSVAGGFCATQAMCTHRAGPLSEGTVDDTTVTCPLHGSRFDIWTGAVLRGPATEPLKTYRVSVEGDIGRVSVE